MCIWPQLLVLLHQILTVLIQNHDSSLLGASLFSVGDIHVRLREFRMNLHQKHNVCPRLYFAKVDVKSAFDSIPQEAVLRLMGNVPDPAHKRYTISKHVEIRHGGITHHRNSTDHESGQYLQRWHTTAAAGLRTANQAESDKKNTLFVYPATAQTHSTASLLSLLADHVDTNLVRIGKHFYRQKDGIPQGGVLSSLICNYFYGHLEAEHLDFVKRDDGSLLLRLIDDFLLITTDKAKAVKFLEVMHAGVPRYGVCVNTAKTLVNFDVNIAGQTVANILKTDTFPYCGTRINTCTLDISRDRDRMINVPVSNSLTVDYGRRPGHNFQRRILSKC